MDKTDDPKVRDAVGRDRHAWNQRVLTIAKRRPISSKHLERKHLLCQTGLS